MTAGTLPTLFGRLTTLLDEHEHLGNTLARLRAMCATLETGGTPPAGLEPTRLLTQLVGELSRHFTAEEAEGHFGTMAKERPALLTRILELKTDHAAMLRAIGDLGLMAADETRWRELPAPTLRLITNLQSHEQAEAALVHEFMTPHERPS